MEAYADVEGSERSLERVGLAIAIVGPSGCTETDQQQRCSELVNLVGLLPATASGSTRRAPSARQAGDVVMLMTTEGCRSQRSHSARQAVGTPEESSKKHLRVLLFYTWEKDKERLSHELRRF